MGKKIKAGSILAPSSVTTKSLGDSLNIIDDRNTGLQQGFFQTAAHCKRGGWLWVTPRRWSGPGLFDHTEQLRFQKTV